MKQSKLRLLKSNLSTPRGTINQVETIKFGQMSTELKKYASVMPATPTIPFTNVTTMSLTRFAGGPAGTKLQVTIQNGTIENGIAYTHLNKAQIKDLINTLQEAFDLTNEPDCDQDEEILSNCCGADSWWSDESLCGQCFEHADFI